MILYGELAYGESLWPDLSVPSLFTALLADPDAQFVHLIELYPYDEASPGSLTTGAPYGTLAFGEFDFSFGGGLTRVDLSDMGFTTRPDDVAPNRHYKALVDNPVQYDTAIMSGGEFQNGSVSFGSIVITNGDGELDDLADYRWSGRRAVVKVGAKGFTYDQFATVFDGAVNDFEVDDDRITITIQDNRIRTDQFLTVPAYLGTGGKEGGTDLQGYIKPLCFGKVFNIEPVLVDAATLIYQIHDGAILSVQAVRDAGVLLTSGGDVPDITAATPSAGQFITQLSGGYIKLGSTPTGRVTADAEGDATGGYVSNPGDIIKRIVGTRIPYPFSVAEIDDGAFVRIDDQIGDTGFFTSEPITASDVIDQLLLPCLAYWTFSRDGQISGGIIDAPDVPTLDITANDIDEQGIEILQTIPPTWRITVGYAPLGVVQGENELAGATTDADRAFLGAPYRYVTVEDQNIRTGESRAVERAFMTSLTDKADAEALLSRLQAVFMTSRRVYGVPLWGATYRTYLGSTVNVAYPRFGMSGGKNLLVVGLSEDAQTGQTVLNLWG